MLTFKLQAGGSKSRTLSVHFYNDMGVVDFQKAMAKKLNISDAKITKISVDCLVLKEIYK